jgi:hypothetical protein
MTARLSLRHAAIGAAYAAAGTLGWLAGGPALGPALWWAMHHEPTPPPPSVLSVALLVLGVIWVSAQDSGEESEPVRPVSAGRLVRLFRRLRVTPEHEMNEAMRLAERAWTA